MQGRNQHACIMFDRGSCGDESEALGEKKGSDRSPFTALLMREETSTPATKEGWRRELAIAVQAGWDLRVIPSRTTWQSFGAEKLDGL